MSHNRHYIIVNAVDSESANYEVERTLTEWGTDNNWFSVCKTVDLNDLTDEDREYLNQELDYLNQELSQQKYDRIKSDVDKLYPQASMQARHLFWQVSQYCNTLYEISKHVKYLKDTGKEKYTIEDLISINDYFGFQYDEYGITNTSYDDKDTHIFFIEVDMHS